MNTFFTYLNVAIGVSFIYLILSLLISEVQESITALLELRAVNLRSSLTNLLEGKNNHDHPEKAVIMQALYKTSLMKSMNQGRKGSKGPSYIPKEVFSAALLEVLKTRYQLEINNEDDIDNIASKIDNKLQEYQGISTGQQAQNQAVEPPFGYTQTTFDEGNQGQLGQPPTNQDNPISAWNDPSLEQPIVPPDMVTMATNIQNVPSLASSSDPQNISQIGDTIPTYSQPSLDNSGVETEDNRDRGGEDNVDVYFLTNLSTLARRLQDKVDKQEVKLVEFQKGIAEWFDQSMVRASGTYKRNSKLFSFSLGLIVAVLANVDSINMIDRLYKNQSLSDTVNQLANQVVENNSQAIVNLNAANSVQDKSLAIQPIKDNINVVVDQLTAFPIGWKLSRDFDTSPPAWISRLAGWFISAIAFSMGAPFWFELLNKFINVRNAGQRPKTGQDDTPNSQT